MDEVPSPKDVGVEVDGDVAILTIHRPAARNDIGLGTMAPLRDAIQAVADSDAHVLVIRGSGEKVFVSGGDLKELARLRTAPEAQQMALTMRSVLDLLAGLPIPVVGGLNADAYGAGCPDAMAGDFRNAAADVRPGFNPIALRILPAWGGIERPTAIRPRSRAVDLLLTGR